MRITGYCERCHRIKMVRVSRLIYSKVQTGICSACEAEQDRQRDERRNPKKGTR